MPKYIIEREIPGAGKMNAGQLKSISQSSCAVLNKLGPQILWVHSFVTADIIFCVYYSPNEEMVREHGRMGEFPINSLNRIATIIDPVTAE
jgi:hypothetical protein